MGTFIGLKITDLEMQNKGMTSMAGTRWLNQAETLKAKLDEDGTFVAQRLGQVLDAIEAQTAAASIGADVASVSTKTVQAILTAFETAIADRYTKTQVDDKATTDMAQLVRAVSFNDTNGNFTFTKNNGTTQTINILTLIQNVPTETLFDQRYYTKAIIDPILTTMTTNNTTAVNNAAEALSMASSNFVPLVESDDFSVCSGNASLGAGWTALNFPRQFRSLPQVVCTPVDVSEATIVVKSITEIGFMVALIDTGTAITQLGTRVPAQFVAGQINYIACLDDGLRL